MQATLQQQEVLVIQTPAYCPHFVLGFHAVHRAEGICAYEQIAH